MSMSPGIPIPATLSAPHYDRLVKLLALHYAYPLPYPLAGAYFEELFAAAVGGIREERKLLFDVLRGRTGWSLKTLLHTRAPGNLFEVVIQRCDILKDRALSLDSPTDLLGARILAHFNTFAQGSIDAQNIDDPRAGFLIRDRAERDFRFFQERSRLYTPGEVAWRWANTDRKSLIGFVDDRLVLRWYRSGTQLFGVYRIPLDAHSFQIDWTRANLDDLITFFTDQGVMRIAEDS